MFSMVTFDDQITTSLQLHMPPAIHDALFLERLRAYYAKYRAFPSYQRLASCLGLASRSAVKKVLERFAKQGFVARNEDAHWIPGGRFFERTIALSSVAAGVPTLADDVGAESFAVDRWLVRAPAKTVFVPVQGDSMIDAGIHEGDVAVVERQTSAQTGQLVIALVDGQWTLKTLGEEGGTPVLFPANAAYAPIRPQANLQIGGIVVGILRRYGR